MLTNWEIALKGKDVQLVPYRRKHVPTYHDWMQDPWIREMTASEPLSLEEEYAMQLSWKEDPKKCTFIVLALSGGGGGEGKEKGTGESAVMAGDVNLFFNDYEDPGMCEVEVMIAEEGLRRRGLAKEAVLMLMRYALDNLGTTTFYCKIGDANVASRALFEKLGFRRHAYVEAFKETELRLQVAGGTGVLAEGVTESPEVVAAAAAAAMLRTQTEHVETMPYPAPAEIEAGATEKAVDVVDTCIL
ncbi:unnamed protein product [Ectocarpus sp. 6 AP-2014]